MRRFFIFFLIVHLSTGNLVGGEMVKIPFLARHFRLYTAANPGGSWQDFLRLHYANTKHRNTDPEHRQLPFHSTAAPVIPVMLLPALSDVAPIPPAGADLAVQLWQDETLLPADYRSRLLRPPRSSG